MLDLSRTRGLPTRVAALAVALALLLVGLPRCSDARRLERDLHSQDPDVRASAARRYAEREPKKAVPVLIRLLDDRSARVRVEAASALGRLRARRAAKPLGALVRDTDARVRLAAVHALGQLGREAAEDYLIDAVMDRNRMVRRTARNRLADLGVPRPEQQRLLAARRLVRHRRALVDRLPARRLAAVKALGRSGRPEVVRDLEKLVADPYVSVGEEAAEALGLVGTPEAVAALERLAAHSAHGRRLATRGLVILLEARHGAARAAALRLLSDPAPELRESALAYLLDPAARASRPGPTVLCAILDDPEPSAAVAAAFRLLSAGVVCPRPPGPAAPRPGGPGAHKVSLGAVAVLGALTRPEALSPEEAAWVTGRLSERGPRPDVIALVVAARRGAPALQALALARVQQAYQALLEASERWLDEPAWKRLDALRLDPGGGTELASERPASPGSSGARPSGDAARRARQLHRLLDRFPDRPGDLRDELLPPKEDPARLGAALRHLSVLPAARPWLASLTERGPAVLRRAAWDALRESGCGETACLAAVERALAAPEPSLRVAAIGAVATPGPALADRLLPLVADADARIRGAAAAALARSRSLKAWPALLAAFRRSREVHLVEAMGRLGDPQAERVLLGLLREEHAPLQAGERLAAIEALARVGTNAATERLLPELEHPEPAIRRGAALALARLGDRRAATPLAVCAEDFYRAVRTACAEARAQVLARDRRAP